MGKSSSGKDTLFRKIKQELPMLQTVTLYTTRPKREGEREGVEYHFVTDEQMHIFERQGKVVELRTYNTVHGAWKYATIEDGQVNLAESDYLMIGTLESYGKLKKYYGAAYLVPVYIEVEDGERLNRALHGSGPCSSHKSAMANNFASIFFPVPRSPFTMYACDTRFSATAFCKY